MKRLVLAFLEWVSRLWSRPQETHGKPRAARRKPLWPDIRRKVEFWEEMHRDKRVFWRYSHYKKSKNGAQQLIKRLREGVPFYGAYASLGDVAEQQVSMVDQGRIHVPLGAPSSLCYAWIPDDEEIGRAHV